MAERALRCYVMEVWGIEKERPLSPETKRAPAASKAGGAREAVKKGAAAAEPHKRLDSGLDAETASKVVLTSLEDDKAEEIVAIDIRGKSSIADLLIVASGRSARHVGALADHVTRKLKEAGAKEVRIEGMPGCDWVLVDAGDVIVHLFRPEVRTFYNIEKIWTGAPGPSSLQS
jgi:ribosome-associated protein